MRVAQRLEENVAMPAGLHDRGDLVVAAQPEPPECSAIVLVVHLELAGPLQPADKHVRPRTLNPEQEDRTGRTARAALTTPPCPLSASDRQPLHGIELVLLDQPAEPLGTRPPGVHGQPSPESTQRGLLFVARRLCG